MSGAVLISLAGIGLALALVPALLFFANLRRYRVPPCPDQAEDVPAVSLLIPARNEAAAIGSCVTTALQSTGVNLEVIVLDDGSEDETRAVVDRLADTDPRVRVESAPPLPPGWCGKQHACHVLASLARHPVLAFIDADVRLTPDGLSRAAEFLRSSGAVLVSGVPRQETVTPLERLLIPLIHFLLLAFLPIERMRRSTLSAYGAGCGQLFLTTRDAYARAGVGGGHASIRASLHDGIQLPRAYRRAGLMTDLFDATPVATCRMYRSAAEVWHGLAKNATEGMASPAAIVPWTVILLGGQVMPALLLAYCVVASATTVGFPTVLIAVAMCAVAVAASYATRIGAASRFGQSWVGAALHPLGVVALVLIQWFAFLRQTLGVPSSWRGRSYGSPGRAPV